MPEEPNQGSPFTRVIDLTTRAQEAARQAKVQASLVEPDPPLPGATLETLPPAVRRAVENAGWDRLMPVQEKAIPYMLDGRDLIVQSRTGSGKTGAFLLPLFTLLDPEKRAAQALILTPTRELARQIHEEFVRMRGDAPEGLSAALVYGGVRYGPQNRALQDGAQIVIGTPGRILDHLERATFRLDALRVLILDEADEMLSMGFYPAMRQLKRYLPARRQSYMFSATMPPKVRALAREFLREPGFLSLSAGHESVDAIEHRYYKVDPMEKDRALVRLIELENPDSAIIFANTKRDVEYLAQFLTNYGYDAAGLTGDLPQRARERIMDRIRKGQLRFLVATDVAARGIDISDLSHVIIYDVPQDQEIYIHRTGRTARAGKTGTALVLTTFEDERTLLAIAHRYAIDIEKRPLPGPEDVARRVAERMTVVLEDRYRDKTNLARERLQRFVPLVEELAEEEPELLAMLVDDLYHELMHRAPEQPEITAEEAARREAADAEDAEMAERKKRRGRGKRRGGRKRGRGD
ncbi:DEAD/DEAH box helicase [Rhodocaloribacter litoris]|uniref:DEAD/DEAH box helicase n=1 Tax=Rhodocaloribacter litoris TaxID=2558931 RepID=UPI001422116A|nr:DEAD/DEAH box helicase [Rhodocaloribacter litoris]QXD13735.1 DEAD/DEAH box helicase [Rhodocaloribacter litoris]